MSKTSLVIPDTAVVPIETRDQIQLTIIEERVGALTTNSAEVLAAIKAKCEGYLDVDKYIGREDVAKKDRAELNNSRKAMKASAKEINARWMSPLDQFNANVKEIDKAFEQAVTAVDTLVKSVEEKEQSKKREVITKHFAELHFDLVPLDRIFDDRWLNKGTKMADIEKELSAKTSEIYANIKVLERIPEHGMMAKALYLDTLDMGAALRKVDELKDAAERLAREKTEREAREHREQVARNAAEVAAEEKGAVREAAAASLASAALDLDEAPPPSAPTPPKFCVASYRFKGLEEDLLEMGKMLKSYMAQHNITHEKL